MHWFKIIQKLYIAATNIRNQKGNDAIATKNVNDNESEDDSEERNIDNAEVYEYEEYKVNGEKVYDIKDETDKKNAENADDNELNDNEVVVDVHKATGDIVGIENEDETD